mmetsp:Transcript_681/g.572  ORF Transcript_681/g.572 Transcript_681/m.572 type:complete len:133 (+) Transcript_681:381-779(+)
MEDDEKVAELFEEVKTMEKEKADLAALAPPQEPGPMPALSETDKIILAGFEDLLLTVDEIKMEWVDTFELKKEEVLKFVDMLGLPEKGDDDGMMKRSKKIVTKNKNKKKAKNTITKRITNKHYSKQKKSSIV